MCPQMQRLVQYSGPEFVGTVTAGPTLALPLTSFLRHALTQPKVHKGLQKFAGFTLAQLWAVPVWRAWCEGITQAASRDEADMWNNIRAATRVLTANEAHPAWMQTNGVVPGVAALVS